MAEGIKGEIETIAEALLVEIQADAEANGAAILFTNNNFYLDADKNGEADKDDKGATIRYNAWTPRLMKAAFNYRYIYNDPGSYVHNPKYVMQFLIDSIEDLGGDVSKYTRPEVPAPAQ